MALAVVGGIALRWVHLGTPSLWWDEIVEIAMAQVGGVADVLFVVRHGVPPGAGNAGAMPLDYLLLHAWLAATSFPAPEHLETYFRFPAFVWSAAALVVFALFARRHLDADVGLVATVLFAVSVPLVLYAAEVRFYALLVLVTVGHVWAFARLLDAPAATGRWVVWLAVACASVLTGVLSVIPLAAELVVLFARSRRALVVALPLVALVLWLALPSLGVTFGRPSSARPGLLATVGSVMQFLAWGYWILLAGFVAGVVLGWRRPLVVALVLSFVAIPVVTLLADAKTYYVHPRHLIFLLPAFVIVVALGLVGVARAVVGARCAGIAAVTLVIALQGPTIVRYVVDPNPFFARTKTLHDVRGVVAPLGAVPTGTTWLLLAERESVTNAVVDAYLRWWRLADRVAFRGTREVPAALRLLADPNVPLERLAGSPLATVPVGLTPDLRRVLGITADVVPPRAVDGVTVVAWEAPAVAPEASLTRRVLPGAWVFER
ncbi:MAG TPA: glycosyltransferase family 39 protein [Candidatus Binatia bacterium]|nr:glycosyltransferase family 39 protein [Candidatus Binatia bacterium]